MEIWKSIEGYEGLYEVSSLCRIKSLSRIVLINDKYPYLIKEKMLKYSLDKDGYAIFRLTKNKKRKRLFGHRLVAIAFISNPENKPQVNHKNGIKTDNRVENLEWSTSKENVKHSWLNGLCSSKKGIDSHFSKLTEKQVLEIREIGRKYTLDKISKIYNISIMSVHNIIERKRWNHI